MRVMCSLFSSIVNKFTKTTTLSSGSERKARPSVLTVRSHSCNTDYLLIKSHECLQVHHETSESLLVLTLSNLLLLFHVGHKLLILSAKYILKET